MNLNKEKILRMCSRFLKRTKPYAENRLFDCTDELNYQLLYVLIKGNQKEPEKIIAYAGMPEEEESVMLFFPLGNDYSDFKETWAFNYEQNLFTDLEEGYDLLWASDETHVNVWYTMDMWKDEIETKEGMKIYLDHCLKNGINVKFLQKKFAYNGMDAIEKCGRSKQEVAGNRDSRKSRKKELER